MRPRYRAGRNKTKEGDIPRELQKFSNFKIGEDDIKMAMEEEKGEMGLFG